MAEEAGTVVPVYAVTVTRRLLRAQFTAPDALQQAPTRVAINAGESNHTAAMPRFQQETLGGDHRQRPRIVAGQRAGLIHPATAALGIDPGAGHREDCPGPVVAQAGEQVCRAPGETLLITLYRAIAGVESCNHEIRLQRGHEIQIASPGIIPRDTDYTPGQPGDSAPQTRHLPTAVQQQLATATTQVTAADK